jgi:histone acetyltransferase
MDSLADGKRKAEEEPDSPSDAKRVKHDEDSVEPVEEKKPVMKPIPFPEKVCDLKVPA